MVEIRRFSQPCQTHSSKVQRIKLPRPLNPASVLKSSARTKRPRLMASSEGSRQIKPPPCRSKLMASSEGPSTLAERQGSCCETEASKNLSTNLAERQGQYGSKGAHTKPITQERSSNLL
ncbi:unnamed protein product [Prunus armeniaca]|uniref:Uncharacterized protein n=1 Tax=Prunus armeniaca TaxID=36596 RepID=A0A6J5XSB5_PRUAR|nr:unnamed protein product [Prunus armeniaca]